MKPKIRRILSVAIEDGIQRGYNRAHKHVSNPQENHIWSSIEDAIWFEIDTYFNFEDDD